MHELYEEAERNNIRIYVGSLPAAKALSIPGYVALDYSLAYTMAEERYHTGHELGHCIRYAFYMKNDPDYIIKRCENKADKWAIKKLVPKDELEQAVAMGITEPWDLAEYFIVPQWFMELAIWYYRTGSLAMPSRPQHPSSAAGYDYGNVS